MERPPRDAALVAAAHVMARGGELDRKLDSLAEQVVSAAASDVAVIYVLDQLAGTLVPAAGAGIDAAALAQAAVIDLADPQALVARTVRERRPATADGDGGTTAASPGGPFASAMALPLVFTGEAGDEDTEGALLVAYGSAGSAGAADDESLSALADLCAVAIRHARLEHTLQERAEWIGRVASSDSLTGLPNRTTFERMLELELARATRQQTELSIVLFDVDGITGINAEHGADVGDDVLRMTASLLAEQVRLVDGVARIGPDEFGLVAPGGGGAVVARRIRDAAARVPLPAGGHLSLSAAVVVFPHDGASTAELMARGSEVLAEAKTGGPGSVVATREWQPSPPEAGR